MQTTFTYHRPASRNHRSRRLRPTTFLAIAIVGVLAAGTWSALAEHGSDPFATDPQWQLTVVQDESSMEESIAAFLKARTDWKVKRLYLDEAEEDLMLEYAFTFDAVPEIELRIDTEVSGHVDNDTVTERLIRVFFFHELPDTAKTPEVIVQMLAFNNMYLFNRFAPDRILIDEDGDLFFATTINLPGPMVSVHGEMVYDAVVRMVDEWQEYWPKLAADVPQVVE